ncbi:SDR family oxidoreductase [Methylobacillus flagellatus]|uniref:Short-chain dehydrogenase/reductase SDR n=1 Tax=Methylobacillus flagellatus (strain ATCC 51484 / DSM 6875 / VKM B-1610 / KT) TaxID=265072 RepID=Q1GXU8_METFK|nr:SDR family oxidoreductase [Methylobacillus flagellatus]ABE50939.1 short-chain dehydrogenase/reductase SDR [Methylobacillus flagellatus KT]
MAILHAPAAGQRVFITGASSGIGLALARHYLRQGAIVGVTARRTDLLYKLAAEFPDGQCLPYQADVRDAQAMQATAQAFIQAAGVPHIVIANAGVSCGTLSAEAEDITAFHTIFEINVFGMLHTFQPFIAAMRESGLRGQLVGIASVAGIRGLPGAGAYSASKSAAITYLESLRTEMQHDGIAVTTIAPGYIRTPMTDVNGYRMPFLMEVDIAASKFAHAISRRKRFVVIPWQMGWVARILHIIPHWLWDRLTRNAPHKPRIEL